MSTNAYGFIEWKYQFASREKGRRMVRYYLKDTNGDSVLAVVGKERSYRHMFYSITPKFLQHFESSNESINANCKWKTKRDAVNWLNSLLLKPQPGESSNATCEPEDNNLSCRPQQGVPPYKVGEKIELLSQDSGIRGVWFRCTVLLIAQKKLKVQYDDVLDVVDGTGNIKEWVPIRAAAPDKLGMRCSGRLTTRPLPAAKELMVGSLEIGTSVDAWHHQGWWEGVVTGTGNHKDDSVQVYFPGENRFNIFQPKDLRISRDWVANQWVDILAKPDILSAISAAVNPGTKLTPSSNIMEVPESGRPTVSNPEAPEENSGKDDIEK